MRFAIDLVILAGFVLLVRKMNPELSFKQIFFKKNNFFVKFKAPIVVVTTSFIGGLIYFGVLGGINDQIDMYVLMMLILSTISLFAMGGLLIFAKN